MEGNSNVQISGLIFSLASTGVLFYSMSAGGGDVFRGAKNRFGLPGCVPARLPASTGEEIAPEVTASVCACTPAAAPAACRPCRVVPGSLNIASRNGVVLSRDLIPACFSMKMFSGFAVAASVMAVSRNPGHSVPSPGITCSSSRASFRHATIVIPACF